MSKAKVGEVHSEYRVGGDAILSSFNQESDACEKEEGAKNSCRVAIGSRSFATQVAGAINILDISSVLLHVMGLLLLLFHRANQEFVS